MTHPIQAANQNPSRAQRAPARWTVYVLGAIATAMCISDPVRSIGSYCYSRVFRDHFALYRMHVENARLEAANTKMKSELVALRSGRSRSVQSERRIDEKVARLENLIEETTGMSISQLSSDFDSDRTLAASGQKSAPPRSRGKLAAILASPELAPKGRSPRASTLDASGKGGVGGAEDACKDTQCQIRELKKNIALVQPTRQKSIAATEPLEQRMDRLIWVMRVMPIGVPVAGEISSGFGRRRSPFSRHFSFHHGIDLSVGIGQEVVATGAGVVQRVAYNRTYGTLVDVAHTSGLVTRYAHLAKTLVKPGDSVVRGERIALSGSSGRSTGPHLHYEVIVKDRARNPKPFIMLADLLAQHVS
jgi:murein DD-endopeptidase MepM/ murein hydrolase activator NlpD